MSLVLSAHRQFPFLLQHLEDQQQGLAGVSASLREGRCPGKGRENGRHPGNSGSG